MSLLQSIFRRNTTQRVQATPPQRPVPLQPATEERGRWQPARRLERDAVADQHRHMAARHLVTVGGCPRLVQRVPYPAAPTCRQRLHTRAFRHAPPQRSVGTNIGRAFLEDHGGGSWCLHAA